MNCDNVWSLIYQNEWVYASIFELINWQNDFCLSKVHICQRQKLFCTEQKKDFNRQNIIFVNKQNYYTDRSNENGTLTKQVLLKWGHNDRIGHTLKMLLNFWNFGTLLKSLYFSMHHLRTVGQRAVKLPAIKLWE